MILHHFVPAARLFDFSNLVLLKVIGGAMFVFGMWLSMYGSKQFKENETEILPMSESNRVLVTDGVYKFSRNSMYLGMVITLLGIALYLGTLLMFLAAVAHFLVLNFVFIPFEERKLERIFGEKYLEYKRSVRRWV